MNKDCNSVDPPLTTERDKVEKEFKEEICLAFYFGDYEEENLALNQLVQMAFGAGDKTDKSYSERIEALVDHFGNCVFEPALR
jgi:hypothetical protein